MRWWTRMINSGLFLKVTAIMMSVWLWIYVLGTDKTSIELPLELNIVAPKGQSVLSSPTSIQLILKGPRALLRDINEPQVQLDLKERRYRGKRTRLYQIDTSRLDFNLPFGIDIIEVKPDKFQISLEKTLHRMVTVELSWEASEPPEEVVDFGPKKVGVSGPISMVKQLKVIKTQPLDSTLLEKNGVIMAGLKLPDEHLSLTGADRVEVIFKRE